MQNLQIAFDDKGLSPNSTVSKMEIVRSEDGVAMSEWRELNLGNICKRIITGGTPDTKTEIYYQHGTVPWVKTKEVNYKPIFKTESYITQAGLENSSAKMIPENSIIVAMYGQGDTAGRVAVNNLKVG